MKKRIAQRVTIQKNDVVYDCIVGTLTEILDYIGKQGKVFQQDLFEVLEEKNFGVYHNRKI
ncbi:MAG: hypothetical protein LBF80_04595 [Spirochaetaceae bacterium]|jgi:hypothetical protein|nr:hypothetical protein [Spirochaetaceae bacterium]